MHEILLIPLEFWHFMKQFTQWFTDRYLKVLPQYLTLLWTHCAVSIRNVIIIICIMNITLDFKCVLNVFFVFLFDTSECLAHKDFSTLLLLGLLLSSNPLYYLSATHQELAKPAFYNFSNSIFDVPPAESTIQCFIHPTGSLTVNKLKMVILLSGNTTWLKRRPPPTRTQSYLRIHKHMSKHTR